MSIISPEASAQPVSRQETNTVKPQPREAFGIGVVGCGYWGPNLLRNFHENPDCQLVAVFDLNPKRLAWAKAHYPHVRTTFEVEALIASPDIHAIAIATPIQTHFELAMRCLKAGKHVLVEKPLAHRSDLARQLIAEAAKRELVLMVDHTFIYTPAVRKIRQLVDAGELGEIFYYDSARINLGLVQADVNVLWDLAVRDLSIVQYLFPESPQAVSATGMLTA